MNGVFSKRMLDLGLYFYEASIKSNIKKAHKLALLF